MTFKEIIRIFFSMLACMVPLKLSVQEVRHDVQQRWYIDSASHLFIYISPAMLSYGFCLSLNAIGGFKKSITAVLKSWNFNK